MLFSSFLRSPENNAHVGIPSANLFSRVIPAPSVAFHQRTDHTRSTQLARRNVDPVTLLARARVKWQPNGRDEAVPRFRAARSIFA